MMKYVKRNAGLALFFFVGVVVADFEVVFRNVGDGIAGQPMPIVAQQPTTTQTFTEGTKPEPTKRQIKRAMATLPKDIPEGYRKIAPERLKYVMVRTHCLNCYVDRDSCNLHFWSKYN